MTSPRPSLKWTFRQAKPVCDGQRKEKKRVIGSQEKSGGSRCQKQSLESPISGKSSEAEASAGGLLELQQKALGKMRNQGIQ